MGKRDRHGIFIVNLGLARSHCYDPEGWAINAQRSSWVNNYHKVTHYSTRIPTRAETQSFIPHVKILSRASLGSKPVLHGLQCALLLLFPNASDTHFRIGKLDQGKIAHSEINRDSRWKDRFVVLDPGMSEDVL